MAVVANRGAFAMLAAQYPSGRGRGLKVDDPYKTLGLSRDASAEEIRRAYRALAKAHHPDLNPGNLAAEERFKNVSVANELLSDAEKRGRFDRGEIDAAGREQERSSFYRDYAEGENGRRYGRDGPQSGGWSTEDINDIFGKMFSEGQEHHGTGRMHGRDELYVMTTDFLEAVNGAVRRLTLPDGRVLDVKIPPGTAEGQVLRLRGQGNSGANGGFDGDALIEIHVASHRYFVRDDRDIRLVLPVSLSDAILGGSVDVPTPAGPVRMRIPAHSDGGTELRLRGRGVPAHDGRAAGDLYAKLRMVVGGPDAALDEFLRNWKPEHPVDSMRMMEGDQ